MYQGLDLSRFKKLASDKKTTTLRHSKGHELRIAHSSLSPEMRTQIESLKCAQCDCVGCNCGGAVKMAKGGTVKSPGAATFEDTPHALIPDDAKVQTAFPRASFTEEDLGTAEPYTGEPQKYQDGPEFNKEMTQNYLNQGQGIAKGKPSDAAYQAPAAPTAAPTAAAKPDLSQLGQVSVPTGNEPQNAPTEFGAEPTLQETPRLASVPFTQNEPLPVDPDLPAKVEQHLNQQSEMFANELAAGHIHPKTISDLYGSKDTLGKIGMIFGLIVSGAGSGLAHQTNAALDLINKELDRDLDAQKSSNTNAQNWYTQSLKHDMDVAYRDKIIFDKTLTSAQARLADANAELERANTTRVPADIAVAQANRDKILAEIDGIYAAADFQKFKNDVAGVSNTAETRQAIAAGQYLQNTIDKMPQGAERDRAQGVYDTVIAPAIGAKVTDKNAQTGAAAGAAAAAARKAPPGVATRLPGQVKTQATAPKAPGQPGHVKRKKEDVINNNALNALIEESKKQKFLQLPEILTEREQELVREEASRVQAISDMKKAYHNSFVKLNNSFLNGKVNPQLLAAETAALNIEMGRSTAGKTVMAEIAAQGEGAFPNPMDYAGSAEMKYYKTMKRLDDSANNTPTLNRYPGIKLGQAPLPDPFGNKIYTKNGQRAFMSKSGKNKGQMVIIP
jgi:hypothetical protein